MIAVESRFNPIAESGMGAKGLMQIIPRFHLDKLRAAGGEDAVFDPESNILVGARILQEYVYRTGTLEAGLQSVQRRLARRARRSTRSKVMAERERLEQVVRTRGLLTIAGDRAGQLAVLRALLFSLAVLLPGVAAADSGVTRRGPDRDPRA